MGMFKMLILCGVALAHTHLASMEFDESDALTPRRSPLPEVGSALERVVRRHYMGMPPESDERGVPERVTYTPREKLEHRLLESETPADAMRYLCRGISRLTKNVQGRNILMIFCAQHIQFDARFLNQYTSDEIRRIVDKDGNSALMIAMKRSNYPQIKVFFDGSHFLRTAELKRLTEEEEAIYAELIEAYFIDDLNKYTLGKMGTIKINKESKEVYYEPAEI